MCSTKTNKTTQLNFLSTLLTLKKFTFFFPRVLFFHYNCLVTNGAKQSVLPIMHLASPISFAVSGGGAQERHWVLDCTEASLSWFGKFFLRIFQF